MRSDKELLELAAKAAGIKLQYWVSRGRKSGFVINDYERDWNPLTDDGDALRLAVKLCIDIKQEDDCCFVYYETPDFVDSLNEIHDGTDPYAATRRAITRAAAEIGAAL